MPTRLTENRGIEAVAIVISAVLRRRTRRPFCCGLPAGTNTTSVEIEQAAGGDQVVVVDGVERPTP